MDVGKARWQQGIGNINNSAYTTLHRAHNSTEVGLLARVAKTSEVFHGMRHALRVQGNVHVQLYCLAAESSNRNPPNTRFSQ